MANKFYYKCVEDATHQAITRIVLKHQFEESVSVAWRKKVIFVTEKFVGVKNINSQFNPSLNYPGEQVQSLSAFLMRIGCDLEILQDLCLMPPKGCPFENWICCAGPCKSERYFKNHNIKTVNEFRNRLGLKDNLPVGYFEKFKEEWGEILDEKRGENRTESTPFLLLPVRDLHHSVKDTIVAREPGLANFAGDLFVCTDHFKRKTKRGVDRREYSSFTLQNINEAFENNTLEFILNKERHFTDRDRLRKLISLLNRGASMSTVLSRKEFNRKFHIERLSRSFNEMDNNFYANGYDNNGHYGNSYYEQQSSQRHPDT